MPSRPLQTLGLTTVYWVNNWHDKSGILSTRGFCWALSPMREGLGCLGPRCISRTLRLRTTCRGAAQEKFVE